MNNTAEIIRQAVTMTDICRHYGFKVNRAGFICCPFHSGDREPSLKIYPSSRGWNCFGCGKGGSVIGFVEEMHGVGFSEAVRIIDNIFSLGLPLNGKGSYREQIKFRKKYDEIKKQCEIEEEKRRAEREHYEHWLNEWICADLIISALKPNSPGDEICDAYKDAYVRMAVATYMLDGIKEV